MFLPCIQFPPAQVLLRYSYRYFSRLDLLYEDYSSGKLSEKKFTMMSAHYEQEQDANEEKLSELERQHKEKAAAVINAEQFTMSCTVCHTSFVTTASCTSSSISLSARWIYPLPLHLNVGFEVVCTYIPPL